MMPPGWAPLQARKDKPRKAEPFELPPHVKKAIFEECVRAPHVPDGPDRESLWRVATIAFNAGLAMERGSP